MTKKIKGHNKFYIKFYNIKYFIFNDKSETKKPHIKLILSVLGVLITFIITIYFEYKRR